MFAPGVRVVRGPDWNWKNQGNQLLMSEFFEQTVFSNFESFFFDQCSDVWNFHIVDKIIIYSWNGLLWFSFIKFIKRFLLLYRNVFGVYCVPVWQIFLHQIYIILSSDGCCTEKNFFLSILIRRKNLKLKSIWISSEIC